MSMGPRYYYDFLSLIDVSRENKALISLNLFGGNESSVVLSCSIVTKNWKGNRKRTIQLEMEGMKPCDDRL